MLISQACPQYLSEIQVLLQGYKLVLDHRYPLEASALLASQLYNLGGQTLALFAHHTVVPENNSQPE
jgi:hypothetical protein